jgi:hypothetical protein
MGALAYLAVMYQRSDPKEKFWWHGMNVVKLPILDHNPTGNRRIGYRAARRPVGAMLDDYF